MEMENGVVTEREGAKTEREKRRGHMGACRDMTLTGFNFFGFVIGCRSDISMYVMSCDATGVFGKEMKIVARPCH